MNVMSKNEDEVGRWREERKEEWEIRGISFIALSQTFMKKY